MASEAKSALADAPERAAAEKKRKKWIAVAVVAGSAVGIVFLVGLLYEIGYYLLFGLFLAGVGGGAWYLLKDRVKRLQAARLAAKTEREAEQRKADEARRVQDQLEELKKKAGR